MTGKCKFCKAQREDEETIQCSACKGYCHPSCLELPPHIVPAVQLYDWQCNDCKCCYECKDIANENQILFCDVCDRGYHMYCAKPRLKKKPKGDWFCPVCNLNDEKDNKKVLEISQKKDKIDEMPVTDVQDSQPPKDRKCPIVKKYSPIKTCPFHGCDGTGNIRPNNSVHFSIAQCPMSRDERKRERELLSMASEPPCKKPLTDEAKSEPQKTESKKIECHKENLPEVPTSQTFFQTPIEHIVSRTDIEMFEAARKGAHELLALDKEMAPSADGLKNVIFGDVEIQVWYKSQYPLEYSRVPTLYICEYCLEYMKTETIYRRHMAKCTTRHPPGDEIYRKDELSVFEVNGQAATTYCQNLCLMAKLFLDHKTLWLDVAPFLFYVMTIADGKGCHIIGYFSKEKVSFLNYNLSCILVMPHYMKMGFGRMLIDFSYLISQVEQKIGSPERPLSDLGLISYRKFWADKLLNYLISFNEETISVKAISEKLAIHTNDIISTLQYLGMLKYWKGKHLILLKKEVMEEYASKVKQRPEKHKEIDPTVLKWTPTAYK